MTFDAFLLVFSCFILFFPGCYQGVCVLRYFLIPSLDGLNVLFGFWKAIPSLFGE